MTNTTTLRYTFNNTFVNSIRFHIANIIAPKLSDIYYQRIRLHNLIVIENDSEDLAELEKSSKTLKKMLKTFLRKLPSLLASLQHPPSLKVRYTSN